MDKSYWLLAGCYLLPSTVVETSKWQEAKSKKQLSCDVFILFLLFVSLLLGGCSSASSGESEVMRELRKTDHLFASAKFVQTSYFFYPSTMRMVNIDEIPNWNETIKEVRRLSIFSMWPDRFNQTKQDEVINDLATKENFSLYAEMENKYSDVKLLGRKNGAETILIYNDSTSNYVIQLLGKINYVKLIELFGDLRDLESKGTGMNFLVKSMRQDKDRAARQRRYYDRKREIEATEKNRQDSIKSEL